MSLTNHVEIELGDGGERASTDDREEGEVDRCREVLAEEEPGDEHAECRLPALDDVRERHGHLSHAHRRRDVPDRVRDRNLLGRPATRRFASAPHSAHIEEEIFRKELGSGADTYGSERLPEIEVRLGRLGDPGGPGREHDGGAGGEGERRREPRVRERVQHLLVVDIEDHVQRPPRGEVDPDLGAARVLRRRGDRLHRPGAVRGGGRRRGGRGAVAAARRRHRHG